MATIKITIMTTTATINMTIHDSNNNDNDELNNNIIINNHENNDDGNNNYSNNENNNGSHSAKIKQHNRVALLTLEQSSTHTCGVFYTKHHITQSCVEELQAFRQQRNLKLELSAA